MISNSYSQKIEDLGAGVIDFLLRNPKTANKMNDSESIALDIIRDLLKTEGERKHEIEYATAGRNQITINANDGRQAQFVRNEQGKVFLLVDGVIYPIAQELVNEALGGINLQTMGNNTLPPYDLLELEKSFNTCETYQAGETYYYYVGVNGEYLNEISKKTGMPINYIYDSEDAFDPELPKKYLENKQKLPPGKQLRIAKIGYKNQIGLIFEYKWYKDLNGDGYSSFDEFKFINRTFHDNENFSICIPVRTEKYFEGTISWDLFNGYTGELIETYTNKVKSDYCGYWHKDIYSNTLSLGTYTINAKLLDGNSNVVAANNMTFEIILFCLN